MPRERGLTSAAADLCCAQASADSAAAQGYVERRIRDIVRSGADIPALVVDNPTCETANVWRLDVEMDAGAMLNLAHQVVVSVHAEEAAAEVAVPAPRSSGAVQPDGQRHGFGPKEPKLVPSTARRAPTLAAKLSTAMRFLRDELQGEVAATVIETRARRAGIAIKTLKRARAKLGIVSRRNGFGARGKFFLSLPWDDSRP